MDLGYPAPEYDFSEDIFSISCTFSVLGTIRMFRASLFILCCMTPCPAYRFTSSCPPSPQSPILQSLITGTYENTNLAAISLPLYLFFVPVDWFTPVSSDIMFYSRLELLAFEVLI